ncbi:MAG: hypothetical protein RML10_03210 [Geminocystis sp.]|nr:hypothetical protein [Geminocystis sp.]
MKPSLVTARREETFPGKEIRTKIEPWLPFDCWGFLPNTIP